MLRPPTRALPSVIVATEKVLREADGCVELVVVRPHADGKVFAPGCASKPDGDEPVRSPKNKSDSISADSPQSEWDTITEKMMLEFAESGHPIFRATSPLSRGQLKSKGHGKLSIHFVPIWRRLKLFFAPLFL